MAVQLDCPSCGASVKAKRGLESATCQYCGNSVMVPGYLPVSPVVPNAINFNGRSCGKTASKLVALASFLAVGIGLAVYFMISPIETKISSQTSSDVSQAGDELIVMEFGGSGTGEGFFNDPQSIAIDDWGNIYVDDGETCRIQMFDKRGNFLSQWLLPEERETFLSAMSCSGDGTLYMVYNSELYLHDGRTGELLDSLQHPDGWGFDDVDVASDGSILASWYCNRDDIVRFNSDGEIDLLIDEAISSQSGESELSIMVAAGNLGEIYAFGSFNEAVFIFNTHGRFQDRFGDGDSFFIPRGFDVDVQGRLWLSDFGNLLLYDVTGELISTIDPGVYLSDFVIDNNMQLIGLTDEETVVKIDLSNY